MTTPTQQLRDFVAREVRARGESISGTVLTPPKLKNFGAGSSPVWVVDVAIGSNRQLKNVPVKADSRGSRNYAALEQAVICKRQTGEKFQVIGPGDKKIAVTVVKTYTVGDINPLATANLGQQVIRRPFSYYQGDLPGTPNSGLWGTAGFPKIETVDGNGDPI
jgi:hypothetical protein